MEFANDKQSGRTRVNFVSDSKKNIELSSEIFNFKVPENIDIFDETK